jgi:beta-galactosidase
MKTKFGIILCELSLILSSCTNKGVNEEFVNVPVVPENVKLNSVSFPEAFMMGCSYYPEQWPKEQWESDFRKMQELGFNTVRMGEFAWSVFEPEEGQFNFMWMDDAIRLARKYGINTILCTPTANVPPWLREKYHEVLGANSKGNFTLGARKGYNVSSIEYIKASGQISKAMAAHFGNNPAIIGWQLDNEPGYPFELYDPVSLKSFRLWLHSRYQTLDNLNMAWGGAFWNLVYSDWNQIEFPTNNGDGGWNPGEELDYRRFFSDAFANHLTIQSEILRRHIGNRFIYTNWPNLYWSVNPFEAGKNYLDATGWDNYSKTPGLCDYRDLFAIGLNDDIARCATVNQKFFISERQTQVAAHALKASLRTLAYIDLAHGSVGNIYFEFRPPLTGQEQGYVSVLQRDGSYGPAKDEYIKMSEEFNRIWPKIKGTKTVADVALLYSYQNQWEQGFWQRNGLGYDAEAERYYQTLKILGRNIDVIPETAQLDKYKIIAAPGLQMISDKTFMRLKDFVEKGGILIVNKGCGVKDTLNRFLPMVAPGYFKEMAGINIPASSSKRSMSGNLVLGSDNQMKNQTFSVIFPDGEKEYKPLTIIEQIELAGAKPIAFARGGELTGKAVVTMNQYRKGVVVYVGIDSENPDFYTHLAHVLAEKLDIKPILDVPAGLDVMSRANGSLQYLFVLNYTTEQQTFRLPAEMKELITNQLMKGRVKINSLGVQIFERKL